MPHSNEEKLMRPCPVLVYVERALLLGTLLLAGGGALAVADGSGEPGDELASEVTIRRDTFGVPHVLASTEEAAAYGLGWVSGEDHVLVLGRLFQKERGGEAARVRTEFAKSHFMTARRGMYEGAKTGFANLAPWMQRILDAYAAGFNKYVRKHRT